MTTVFRVVIADRVMSSISRRHRRLSPVFFLYLLDMKLELSNYIVLLAKVRYFSVNTHSNKSEMFGKKSVISSFYKKKC
jgi:hypothetical protein